MRKVLLSLLMTIGCSLVIMAQGDCQFKKNPDLRKEMRTYYEGNVYPVLKEAHVQLDNSLPAEDLASLQVLREEHTKLEAAKKAVRKEMKAQVKAGKTKEEAKAAFETEIQQNKSASMEVRKKLRVIAEKNAELVSTTLDPLKPNREKWKADRKAITAKYYSEEEIAACRAKAQENKAKHAGMKPQGAPSVKKRPANAPANMERRKKTKAVGKFLLWDGNMKGEFPFGEK